MILLNKFIFGDLDQFKKDLSYNVIPHVPSAYLYKKIIAFHGYENLYMDYHDKTSYIRGNYTAFKKNNFVEYAEPNIQFLYQKWDTYMSILFNTIDSQLCVLTTKPSFYYGSNIFTLSDDRSIANVMNILQNFKTRRKM